MNNPELYRNFNVLQKRDALQCLEAYAKEVKWNKLGATIIDIGCGDGDVTTTVLKRFIPENCKALIGCDLSEKMIQFANAHHARDFISFMVLDIGGDLPDQLRGKFDHVFSFNVLHWVKKQKSAFSNIYDLLAKGGDCLLLFLGHMPVYDVYRELTRNPRWNYFLGDLDGFVTPYQDHKEPDKDIKTMMTTIGFTKTKVKYVQKEFIFNGIEDFKNSMKAVNPYKIPLEMQEEFYKDFMTVVRDMDLIDHSSSNVDGQFNVKLNYKIIEVYGQK